MAAKPFDTSGKSPAHIHHPPILQNALWPIRPALSGAIALACALRTIARVLPAALADARARGDIDVNAIPDLNKATAIAATAQTRAAAVPRLIIPSLGCCIDHPDPELGERLMVDALGVAHRSQCPLFPQQRTFRDAAVMSALCQLRHFAPQQPAPLFDHLVGLRQQRWRAPRGQVISPSSD